MTVATKTLTLDEIADFLHPDPPRGALQRVVVEGVGSTAEEFFRRNPMDGTWRMASGPYNNSLSKAPRFADLMAESQWARLRFSPTLNRLMNNSELSEPDVLYAVFALPMISPERIGYFDTGHREEMGQMLTAKLNQVTRFDRPVYDPSAAEDVRAKLAALDFKPSLVINAGDRIEACWRLSHHVPETNIAFPGWKASAGVPVAMSAIEASRYVLCNHRLALKLGGDVRFANLPVSAVLEVPGTSRNDVQQGRLPHHPVTAEIVSDALYDFEAIMEWVTT
jgi:hypothetical protein